MTSPHLTAQIDPRDRGYQGAPSLASLPGYKEHVSKPSGTHLEAAEPADSVQTEAPRPEKAPKGGTRSVAKASTPKIVAVEPAAPVEAPSPAARKPRTGASARFNGDNVWIYRAVNAGVVIVALAAVMASWQGLVAVAAWFLPTAWTWVLPIALDVAIVVFTLGILPRKSRGESTWLLSLAAYALTSISAAANALHVILEPLPNVESDLQRYVGASLAALMPMLVLLTTEVLGMLITKPTRAERAREKLATVKAEAELKKPTARKKPAAPKKTT